MLTATFLATCLMSLAYVNAAASNMIVHESRKSTPRGFVDSGPAPQDTSLNLRIALVQGNMTSLEQELYAVSTPGDDRYGQHLTKEEV